MIISALQKGELSGVAKDTAAATGVELATDTEEGPADPGGLSSKRLLAVGEDVSLVLVMMLSSRFTGWLEAVDGAG